MLYLEWSDYMYNFCYTSLSDKYILGWSCVITMAIVRLMNVYYNMTIQIWFITLISRK